MRGIAVLALIASACSFTPGAFPADAGPDGPPPVTVGFDQATTLADEESSVVAIKVVLSAPAESPISVGYAVTGGTATRTVDYLADDGTLTFAPGDVEKTIEVTVGPDAEEEPDETVQLELQSVTGAAVLGTSLHTLTISANILPRISFALASASSSEDVSPTLDVTLNTASQLQVTATITIMGGTATDGGIDVDLSSTTLTFAPGETAKQVTLDVNDDLLDEFDETAIVKLQNPVNVILGATDKYTHTIQDNDAQPTVSFASAASSTAEDAGTVDLLVTLSGASGKDVSVEFSIDGTSTAGGTDYAVATTSPLMFPAGTTEMSISVNITQDTAIEGPETVVIVLGTLTNVDPGADTTHTLTIEDDDATCLGEGSFLACFATPSGTVNVTGPLDTDTSSLCSSAMPSAGWSGQPASCFVVAETINVAATTVTGSRPLVLFASGNITVAGNLDASSSRAGLGDKSGPAANPTACGTYADDPTDDTSGAGGGAGGSFMTSGGNGGEGNAAQDSGGTALAALTTAPTTLRGGCPGQPGADGSGENGSNGGVPGAGGGAVYLVAGGMISIASGVAINASGAAGAARASPASGFFAGGGGAGSGGMIVLHAASFSVNLAVLMANGGGASSGGDADRAGISGNEPSTLTPTAVATGGSAGNTGAAGGNGFADATQATNGSDGGSNKGGGGGGGGGGYVRSNLALTGATVSAGATSP